MNTPNWHATFTCGFEHEEPIMDISPTQLYLDSEKDELFEQGPWPKPFAFNRDVVRVFDNMVSRSVPMYREVVAATAHWARAYLQPDTSVIDVGCSTGTFLELLGRFIASPTQLIAIDNSQAMLDKAREKLTPLSDKHHIELRCESAAESDFSGSSVVVMNYTLQFLPFAQRQQVLNEVHKGLVPGGLLLLSEKTKSAIPPFQETITRHYEAFKERNGYARTEIERKKEALEQVLVPLTEQQQRDMLHKSGFQAVDTILKMHHFTTFVARKAIP
jgi:tRNA (cmo5U34)-methyltransferase